MQTLVAQLYPRIERARAEEALRASEERFRSVFEAIDKGFCIVECLFAADEHPIDYRFLQVNPAFAAMTGLVDAVGRTARDLVPGLEPFWVETYGRVALTGEAVRFEQVSESMGGWHDTTPFCGTDPMVFQQLVWAGLQLGRPKILSNSQEAPGLIGHTAHSHALPHIEL